MPDDAQFCGVCGAKNEPTKAVEPSAANAPAQPKPKPEPEKPSGVPGLAVAGFMLFVVPFLSMMLYLLVLSFFPVAVNDSPSIYAELTTFIILIAYMCFAVALVFTILGMIKSVRARATGGIVLTATSMLCLVLSIAGLPIVIHIVNTLTVQL